MLSTMPQPCFITRRLASLARAGGKAPSAQLWGATAKSRKRGRRADRRAAEGRYTAICSLGAVGLGCVRDAVQSWRSTRRSNVVPLRKWLVFVALTLAIPAFG